MSTNITENTKPIEEKFESSLEAAQSSRRDLFTGGPPSVAWLRDQERIAAFWSNPSAHINELWQTYKPIVLALGYVLLALIGINLFVTVISALISIPLLSPLLELVGIGYSIWLINRYLLWADRRQEFFQMIDHFKQEILGPSSITVKKSVTIHKSPEELYRFWRNFENLPRFMNHLQAVQILDDKRSHWVANAPLNTSVEWDAEIIDEVENHSIVWKSLEGADVDSVGSVTFVSANGSGTEVKVTMQYNPPGGELGAAAAALVGENPQQQLDEDLERFKQVMETT